jgi:hypothetical protein
LVFLSLFTSGENDTDEQSDHEDSRPSPVAFEQTVRAGSPRFLLATIIIALAWLVLLVLHSIQSEEPLTTHN